RRRGAAQAADRAVGQGARGARIRFLHSNPALSHHSRVRGRAGGVYVGHSAADEVGHAAPVRPGIDPCRPHAGRIHRRRGAARCRRRVAVLGATGAVGQTFVRLLVDHPWFELVEVAASERSAGKAYAEAAKWIGADDMPASVAGLTVLACDPAQITADIVFSALDSSVAGDAEPAFARAGKMVLTNAKNHRMAPDVPLVIAEVNPSHLRVLEAQRKGRGWTGGIVANGNCASIVAALSLAPIHQRFGISKIITMTMQAVSGAGYPGVPSLDILGNVIPYIPDEEPKVETEIQKFLGSIDAAASAIHSGTFAVSAHTNRVAVEHGHTICLSVELETKADAPAVEQAIRD